MPESTASGTAPQRRQGEGEKSIITSLVQGVGIFLIIQFVINNFFSGKSTTSSPGGAPGKANYNFYERPEISAIANYSSVPSTVAPIWPDDSTLDMQIYVSPRIAPFGTLGELVVDEKSLKMADFGDTRDISTTIPIWPEIQNNGTLWAHFLVGLSGSELDPRSQAYDPHKAIHFYRQLNQYLPKKKVKKLKSLLDSSSSTDQPEPEEPKGVQIASYYHPNFTVAIIPGTGVQNWRSMHPALRKNIVLETTGARDASGQHGWYYPVVFLNTFWQLRSHMTELNDTVSSMPLNIHIKNLASWKYNLMASMDQGVKENQMNAASGNPMPGGGDGSEFEMFKEILLDTNAYLLGTTFIVSILHMVFEGLAFKNDISHWRKKKDNVGTSFRTIIANVFMQLIIFLYLVDNSEGTSWMILASQGFGIVLEAWKVTKTVNVVVRPPAPTSRFSFLPYVVIFEDKHKLSETEKKTQEYDEIAFRYLYIIAVPLLLAYAAYSLVYETHKSWYSFIITTLVGSVYAYGFLMMVPALYINYRLKSVAHMPARTMTYKFLNTFIDDLFAFTIRMPLLHRLATLRDDVIFFVWLYQKWQYKVDHTRINEFGQGGDSDEEGEEEEKEKNGTVLEGQDTKALKPSAASATASGREEKMGGKKRK
jgi:hypothetical protein